MEYCYSGTESLWYGSWNRHVCRKGKCAADRHSRSSRKQRCCSTSCLWSQAQLDTSDPDNSQNLSYWLTIRHRCICMWSYRFTTFEIKVTIRVTGSFCQWTQCKMYPGKGNWQLPYLYASFLDIRKKTDFYWYIFCLLIDDIYSHSSPKIIFLGQMRQELQPPRGYAPPGSICNVYFNTPTYSA